MRPVCGHSRTNCRSVLRRHDHIPRHGSLATFGDYDHALALCCGSGARRVLMRPSACQPVRRCHHGHVFFLDRVLAKGGAEHAVGVRRAGQHQHARRITIQPVHQHQRAKRVSASVCRLGASRCGGFSASSPAGLSTTTMCSSTRQQPALGPTLTKAPVLLPAPLRSRCGRRCAPATTPTTPLLPFTCTPRAAIRRCTACRPHSGKRRRSTWSSRAGSRNPSTVNASSCFVVSQHLGDCRAQIVHVVLGHACHADAARARRCRWQSARAAP